MKGERVGKGKVVDVLKKNNNNVFYKATILHLYALYYILSSPLFMLFLSRVKWSPPPPANNSLTRSPERCFSEEASVWCGGASTSSIVSVGACPAASPHHAASIMDKSKALYSSGVACLGFICFALGATAVGLPLWGYFENPDGTYFLHYSN
jgi:hypothetical protein